MFKSCNATIYTGVDFIAHNRIEFSAILPPLAVAISFRLSILREDERDRFILTCWKRPCGWGNEEDDVHGIVLYVRVSGCFASNLNIYTGMENHAFLGIPHFFWVLIWTKLFIFDFQNEQNVFTSMLIIWGLPFTELPILICRK